MKNKMTLQFVSTVSCATINPPSSGTVNVTTNGTTSIATFTCTEGYYAVGDVQRICGEDGAWIGSELFCRKWLNYYSLSKIINRLWLLSSKENYLCHLLWHALHTEVNWCIIFSLHCRGLQIHIDDVDTILQKRQPLWCPVTLLVNKTLLENCKRLWTIFFFSILFQSKRTQIDKRGIPC